MNWQHVADDTRAGLRVSGEDLMIAELVMAPFTLAAVLFLGWLIWPPAWLLMVVWLLLQGAAALWNAGWRARTATA